MRYYKRLTPYLACAMLCEGVIEASGDGTRIRAGQGNFADNNNRPSFF